MLSFGYNQPAGVEELAAPTAPANGKPPTGEDTPRQQPQPVYDLATTCGLPWANAGTTLNPCGFPGYGLLYTGSFATYRFMLQHPRIRHARAQVFAPILSNDWGWQKRKDFPEEQYRYVLEMLAPQRLRVMGDALRALDYGRAGFELVWEPDAGRLRAESKPLAVDSTKVVVDKASGKFAGLRYGDKPDEWLKVADRKCWLFTYDGEAGDLNGRSRLENLRATAWRDWIDAASDLARLGAKASGTMGILYTPSGSFKDSNNNTYSWSDVAAEVLPAAKRGDMIHLRHFGPSTLAAGAQNMEQLLNLIKASAVRLEMVNFGDKGGEIASTLERMRHDEDLMFAGYLRSSRTGMQSEHGSRADAEQHTDTDTTDLELIDLWIADAFNRGVVDEVLAVNFGEKARGAVWVKPAKLRDVNRAVDLKVIDAILADPELRGLYVEQLDVDAITMRQGLPKADGVDAVVIDALDGQDEADDGEETDAADDDEDEPESDPAGGAD